MFSLSSVQAQHDLIHEFSLHHGVTASAVDLDGVTVIRVETDDSPGAVWDVRATIGMFDDGATELKDQC